MRHATTLLEPSIETERLIIRPPGEADRDEIVVELYDFAVTRMLAKVPHPYSLADADAYLSSIRRDGRQTLQLSITQGGRIIGGIGISDIDTGCEFGYWLGRAHWGKGYATEAGRGFLA